MINDANKKLRAAIYCRISRDKTDERAGVERQKEDCELLCKLNNWEIEGIYIDNSISAYDKSKIRPEYDKAVQAFRSGNADVIVAWKLDRLVRNSLAFDLMVEELKTQGLRVCTTDLGDLDFRNPDAEFIAGIMVRVAQFESARKSQRSKRANLQRAQKGKMRKGTRLFGYDREGNIISEEAQVVKAIYEQYLKGSSMGAITRAISGDRLSSDPIMPISDPPSVIFAKEQGKPTPNKKWGLATTQSILRNPRYAGYIYHTPVIDGKCQSCSSRWRDFIVRDETTGEYIHGSWTPIVDELTWWQVQELRDKNLTRADGTSIERAGNQKKHIGAGLYRCAICGQPLKSGASGQSAKSKGYNEIYHTYRCDGHVNRMGNKIDEYVLELVRSRLALPDLKDLLTSKNDQGFRLKEIDSKISNLHARIAQCEHDYDEDLIDAKTRKRKIDKLLSSLSKLEDEKQAILPSNVAAGIFNAPNPVDAFNSLSDPAQIAKVIDTLMTVKIKPHERGKRITPQNLYEEIVIEWKG